MTGPSSTTTASVTGSPRPGTSSSASMRIMGASPYQPARDVDTPPLGPERVGPAGRVDTAVPGGGGEHVVPGGTLPAQVVHTQTGDAHHREQHRPGHGRANRVEPEPFRRVSGVRSQQ